MVTSGGDNKNEGRSRPALSFLAALKALAGDPVVEAARRAAEGLGARGYLVGGVLRNLAVGAPPGADYDFVIDGAHLEPFASAMAHALGGTSFVLDRSAPSYRVAVKARPGSRAAVVDASPIKAGEITEDLLARDFTVNAMAVSLRSIFEEALPEVVDPSGGLEDGEDMTLRAVSSGAFDADPLRVMRAVRLAQQYSLAIEAGTMALVSQKSPLLAGVSAERVTGELLAVFSGPGTAASLELICSTGMMDVLVPEASGWSDIGGYDLFAHVIRTVEEAERLIGEIDGGMAFADFGPRLSALLDSGVGPVGFRAALKLAAFFHDTGKALTISREGGRTRFIGHDHAGAAAVGRILTRLRFSRAATALVSGLVRDHHRLFTLSKLARPSPRAKAHLFAAADPDGKGAGVLLLLLSLADVRATIGGEDADLKALVLDMLSYYYGTYAVKKPGPVLTGAEVMEAFGVEEGRVVGEILDEISSAVEAGLVKGKKDAVEHIRGWLSGGRPAGHGKVLD